MTESSRIKLYVYPNAPMQDGLCEEFSNVLPFSDSGINKWCEPVPADEAELFYCGQLTDRNPNALSAADFQYLKGNERRHVIDVDGDWPGMLFPEWLKPLTLTARNILSIEYYNGWCVYPTPGASMLTFDLVNNPRSFTPPKHHGCYFRGRLDWQFGIRDKVRHALSIAAIPHIFDMVQHSYMFPANSGLGPYNAEQQNENMRRFENEISEWSFALCPRAGSHYTQRYYESCALGRVPIVLGDNIWLGGENAPCIRINWQLSASDLAEVFSELLNKISIELCTEMGRVAQKYFFDYVIPYYKDPTEQFIGWARQQEIID